MEGILRFLELSPDFKFNYEHRNFSGQPRSKTLNFVMKKSGITKILKIFLFLRFRKRIVKQIEEKNISLEKMHVDISKVKRRQMCLIYSSDLEDLSLIVGRDLYELWPSLRVGNTRQGIWP